MKNKPKLENKKPREEKSSISRLELEEINRAKFKELCFFLFNPLLTSNFKPTTTEYENVSLKKLISYFEDKNFSRFNNKQILSLCTEVNNRISKQLSINPCNIKLKTSTKNDFTMMKYYGDTNTIIIYADNIKSYYKETPQLIGLQFLFSILHETYHACQNSNVKRFIKGEPYIKSMLNSFLQSTMFYVDELHIKDTEKVFYFKSTKNVYKKERFILDLTRQQMDYKIDFQEFEANAFALNFFRKYKEKGYFASNNNVDKVFYDQCSEFVTQFYVFNRLKRNFKMTRKELIYISNKLDKNENQIITLIKPRVVELLKNFDTEKEFRSRKDQLIEFMSEASKIEEEIYDNINEDLSKFENKEENNTKYEVMVVNK